MFINERNDIKEKMDKMLIQLENECVEIQKQEDIFNNANNVIQKYDLFKSTKGVLITITKTVACVIIIMFVLSLLLSNVFPIKDLLPLFLGFSLYILYYHWALSDDIRRTKGVTEEDYNKAIQDVEESKRKITKLKSKRKSLEDEIKKYEDVLKSIDGLHKNINTILSATGIEQHFACTKDLISNELIDDFNKFLNEPIDHSKTSLVADPTIEENQLKKLIMKR